MVTETPPPMSAPPARDVVPRWARVVDTSAITGLALAAFLVLFGGFVIHLGPLPVRVHSPGPLLFITAALVAIRHAASPRDPLHRRVLRGIRSSGEASPPSIARIAAASRVAVLAVGYFAVVTIGINHSTMGFELSPDAAFNLPARFDAGWYGGIALDGYSFQGRFDRQQNVAFFPAFPFLMRVVGYPLGAFAPGVSRERRMARLLWGGVAISILAFAWASLFLWRLARDTIGEARAPAAVALFAAYPFAVFFSAPYTESLFLLGSIAAIYHFRRQEFMRAAAWGTLVGITRPNGCFLSAVLPIMIIEQLRTPPAVADRDRKTVTALLSAAAPGLGMLAYSAYVRHLTGAWFGWARLHEAWGRSFEGLAPVTRAYGWITDEGLLHVVEGVPYDTLNSLGLIFALLMLWPVVRRLGLAYAAFIVVNVVPPLLAGGVLSMGRLTATLFPLFLALAASLPPRMVTPLVTAFALGQGLAAALFFTWRPLF
jgi:hypothetical protein